MTSLIDADALRDKIIQRIIEEDTEFPEYDWGMGLSIAIDILDRMLPVDAEPVIRCIDCKWFGAWYCDLLHFGIVDLHKYCAWAERKGEKE